MGSTPGRPRGLSRTGRRNTILIIVVLLAAALAYLLYVALAPVTVEVGAVSVRFTGSPCPGWVNSSASGFSADPGSPATLSITLPNYSAVLNCTAQNVTTSTGGFTIVRSNAPLTVQPGTSGDLSVVVRTPSEAFRGTLTVTVDVTTSG